MSTMQLMAFMIMRYLNTRVFNFDTHFIVRMFKTVYIYDNMEKGD